MPSARRKRFTIVFEYSISVLAHSLEEAEEMAYDELEHQVTTYGLDLNDVCIVNVCEEGYNVSHKY